MDLQVSALDQFADLVAGAGSPHRLAERTLEVVMALVDGRSGGVFAVSGERPTLFASRGIDQYVLDAMATLWQRRPAEIRRGAPVYVPECSADHELCGGAAGPASLALLPVLDGERVLGLLYVDSVEPHFCTPKDLERLAMFSRLFARALRRGGETAPEPATSLEAYLERTPVSDIERQKLMLLLNRNEWNIARVARLMGVTRRTIYLRLQRYNIPRERVYKTRLRAAAS
jgi:hypothetical protein